MSILNKSQRAKFFAVRKLMDSVVDSIGAKDASSFNASATIVNNNAVALRTWIAGTAEQPMSYARGDIRVDPADGVPYWSMHEHTSVAGAELQPSATPSIWTHCHGTSADTARPFIAEGHNPYLAGHYCVEADTVYRCKVDNTVHAPSVLPASWERIE